MRSSTRTSHEAEPLSVADATNDRPGPTRTSADRAPRRRPARRTLLAGALAVVVSAGLLVATSDGDPVLRESFEGPDGAFVTERAFRTADLGVAENATWLAESGQVFRRGSAGETDSSVMRMWTRRTDLAFTTAEMDVRFNGWNGGSSGWHGINLWMNETFCTPAPGCTRLQDGATSEGPSGYALDFMNRDGSLTILKKVAGDTRGTWAGAVSYSNGGTYYQLAKTTWTPTVGQTYRWAGRVVDNGDGSTTLQVLVDGRVLLAVVDDARVGGPRLTGGRVGLRSDYADLTVDDLTIRR